MAARIFARMALVVARSELRIRSLFSSPKIAIMSESLSAFSAAINASTAASGVAKVSCGAATATSGALTKNASASEHRNDQGRIMFMVDALLRIEKNEGMKDAPAVNDA